MPYPSKQYAVVSGKVKSVCHTRLLSSVTTAQLTVVVTAGASMQIYIFFSLYSISLSIRDKFSHFLYWAFDRLGVRLLTKTMDYASINR